MSMLSSMGLFDLSSGAWTVFRAARGSNFGECTISSHSFSFPLLPSPSPSRITSPLPFLPSPSEPISERQEAKGLLTLASLMTRTLIEMDFALHDLPQKLRRCAAANNASGRDKHTHTHTHAQTHWHTSVTHYSIFSRSLVVELDWLQGEGGRLPFKLRAAWRRSFEL